jgi:hypothetical protein
MHRRAGERGQSVQVGAVVLFGVLVVVFAVYQAFVVPNQNQQVEFNHNQRVQGDMVEVRNAVLTTKTTGEDGYVTVELGTEFPPRLLALNPPPPTGALYTTDLRPIVVEKRATGTDVTTAVCPGTDVGTRFVEYSPDYAVFRNPGTVRYENSLVYTDFENDDAVRLSSQELVRGGTVQIIPLRRSFNRGGSGTIPVEPKAGLVDTSRRENVTVTLPTRLSERQWEDALAGEVPPGNVTVTDGPGGRNLTVALSGEYRIDCGPVGLGETPPSGPRGGGLDEINPAAPGDIRLQDATSSGSTVTLTFNNTGGTNNFTQGRINFYRSTGGSSGPSSAVVSAGGTDRATLDVQGEYETFAPKIELSGGDTTDVQFQFDASGGGQAWFVTTLELESGETALYFVPTG